MGSKKVFDWTIWCLIVLSLQWSFALRFSSPFASVSKALSRLKQANVALLEARYYEPLSDQIVQCKLCPRKCIIPNAGRGLCGARINLDGKLYSLVYSRPVAVHNDPIEKKPFSHVLPGTLSFSIATAGCNLGCLFCQNWQISQEDPIQAQTMIIPPAKIVELAQQAGARSIAYTYTEPTIFYEYMLDTAKLARAAGLLNVMHSCGYINPEPLAELLPYLDAVNIDLKGFSEEFYEDLSSGSLEPVKLALKQIKASGTWLEITHLVIPQKNDDPDLFRSMCEWIVAELGPETPLHLAAFYPNYKLRQIPRTGQAILQKFHQIAEASGLEYVYIGNIYGNTRESTFCPTDHTLLVERRGYQIVSNQLQNGTCPTCGKEIPGLWK